MSFVSSSTLDFRVAATTVGGGGGDGVFGGDGLSGGDGVFGGDGDCNSIEKTGCSGGGGGGATATASGGVVGASVVSDVDGHVTCSMLSSFVHLSDATALSK